VHHSEFFDIKHFRKNIIGSCYIDGKLKKVYSADGMLDTYMLKVGFELSAEPAMHGFYPLIEKFEKENKYVFVWDGVKGAQEALCLYLDMVSGEYHKR